MISRSDRGTVWAVLLVSAVACQAAPSSSGQDTTHRPSTERNPRGPGEEAKPTGRVGNNDPRNATNQPDWDGMAAELKTMVDPRLPDPLPADAQSACTQMLDAAKAFYEATEPSPIRKTRRAEELDATREADLEACVAETSVQAAACATVLLGDKDSEFPWVLDQCSRAYPKG